MGKMVITIGRQFGSGGRAIGKLVAKKLGIPFYDKELIKKAMRYAIPSNTISISMLQRKLEIGFPKAGKIIDALVEMGYVSETVNGTFREILMTKEEFEKIFSEPL